MLHDAVAEQALANATRTDCSERVAAGWTFVEEVDKLRFGTRRPLLDYGAQALKLRGSVPGVEPVTIYWVGKDASATIRHYPESGS